MLIIIIGDLFFRHDDLTADHVGKEAVPQNAAADTLAEILLCRALDLELTLEFFRRHFIARHDLLYFIIHFAVAHRNFKALGFLRQNNVVDHAFQRCLGQFFYRSGLIGIFGIQSPPHGFGGRFSLQVKRRYHFAVHDRGNAIDGGAYGRRNQKKQKKRSTDDTHAMLLDILALGLKHSQPCFCNTEHTKRFPRTECFSRCVQPNGKRLWSALCATIFWQDTLIPANLQRRDFLTLSGISVRQKCPQRQSGGIKPARGGQLHIQLQFKA